MRDIQLFMIAGFLGSGKTTFLQYLLTQMKGYRIGVIVNEFGSIGIDGTVLQEDGIKMVEINSGSIFCACLKGGFLKTLVAFLKQPVDYLFVEASGLADPSSMNAFLMGMAPYLERDQQITRRYLYRGLICVVDTLHFLQYSKVFVPAENQIRKSQFLILNKVDDASPELVSETKKRLSQLNPQAFLFLTNYGRVPLKLLNHTLEAQDNTLESSNTPWNRPASYIITITQPVSLAAIEIFCRNVAPMTLRIKGFFPTESGFGHVDCVETQVSIRPYTPDNIQPVGKLVVIGASQTSIRNTLELEWQEAVHQPIQIQED